MQESSSGDKTCQRSVLRLILMLIKTSTAIGWQQEWVFPTHKSKGTNLLLPKILIDLKDTILLEETLLEERLITD